MLSLLPLPSSRPPSQQRQALLWQPGPGLLEQTMPDDSPGHRRVQPHGIRVQLPAGDPWPCLLAGEQSCLDLNGAGKQIPGSGVGRGSGKEGKLAGPGGMTACGQPTAHRTLSQGQISRLAPPPPHDGFPWGNVHKGLEAVQSPKSEVQDPFQEATGTEMLSGPSPGVEVGVLLSGVTFQIQPPRSHHRA